MAYNKTVWAEVFIIISLQSFVMMKRFQNSGKKWLRRTYPESVYHGNKKYMEAGRTEGMTLEALRKMCQ